MNRVKICFLIVLSLFFVGCVNITPNPNITSRVVLAYNHPKYGYISDLDERYIRDASECEEAIFYLGVRIQNKPVKDMDSLRSLRRDGVVKKDRVALRNIKYAEGRFDRCMLEEQGYEFDGTAEYTYATKELKAREVSSADDFLKSKKNKKNEREFVAISDADRNQLVECSWYYYKSELFQRSKGMEREATRSHLAYLMTSNALIKRYGFLWTEDALKNENKKKISILRNQEDNIKDMSKKLVLLCYSFSQKIIKNEI